MYFVITTMYGTMNLNLEPEISVYDQDSGFCMQCLRVRACVCVCMCVCLNCLVGVLKCD